MTSKNVMFCLIFAQQRFDGEDRSGILVEIDVTTDEDLEMINRIIQHQCSLSILITDETSDFAELSDRDEEFVVEIRDNQIRTMRIQDGLSLDRWAKMYRDNQWRTAVCSHGDCLGKLRIHNTYWWWDESFSCVCKWGKLARDRERRYRFHYFLPIRMRYV